MTDALSTKPETIPGTHRTVAVFGGVYNNYLALEAAIADAQAGGAELMVCLGDLGGFGPFPDRVFPLLRDHGVRVMRGNYDESVGLGLSDCGCGYSDPQDNRFAQISYDYTATNTSEANKAWLRDLPSGFRWRLGDAGVAASHGSPRRINEFLWESTTPDGMIHALLQESRADLLLVTHSGIKWQRQLTDGRGLVNVGALGRPENDGRTEVWYALLHAQDQAGWRAEFRPVAYDHARLSREMEQEGLPAEFIETVRTGWWTTCLEVLPARERLRGKY